MLQLWALLALLLTAAESGSPALATIPGGRCTVGAKDTPESGPWRQVEIDAFSLAIRETTVAEFRRYARQMGTPMPAQPEGSSPHHPVVNVTWFEAREFCRHHGLRLPTEVQWERAAWGPRRRSSPFDDEAIPAGAANLEGTDGDDRWEGVAPVGSFPANDFGLHDLFGNVWEWTADAASGSGDDRLLKGGSWYICRDRVGASRRNALPALKRHPGIGFRCAGPPG